ncbi:MAG TPA: cytochrome P450 [Myxococcales bacterium]|nr:cytochrome P450 [Myxococcales bacterium]
MTLPAGPKLPSFVQLLAWTARPLQFLEWCSARYGETFTVNLAGYGRFVLTSNLALIEETFTGDPALLHSGEANDKVFRDALGRRSVLVLDDAPHARQRKLLMPPLHGDRMRAHVATMRRLTLEEIGRWPLGRPLTVDASMREITLQVILKTVFGLEAEAGSRELIERLQEMLDMAVTPLAIVAPLVPEWLRPRFRRWRVFLENVTAVRARLREAIARGRAAADLGQRPDVLAILLQARDESGRPMDDEEVVDELMTLLLAGYDTTAASLSWAVRDILETPEAERKIRAELAAAPGGRLEYLEAACKETMRHRTVVPLVNRLLKAPLTLGGFELPAGVRVCPAIHLVHRRTDLYPDPDAFRPERFLERKFGPYEWLPFGGGDRRCLGMAFALAEMKAVLAELFSTLKLELADETPAKATRRGILLVPKGGTRVVVRERLAPAPERAVA